MSRLSSELPAPWTDVPAIVHKMRSALRPRHSTQPHLVPPSDKFLVRELPYLSVINVHAPFRVGLLVSATAKQPQMAQPVCMAQCLEHSRPGSGQGRTA